MTRKHKKAWVLGWLLCPVALVAFHYGPAQPYRDGAEARTYVHEAKAKAESGDWAGAVEQYDAALKVLSESDSPARTRVRLLRSEGMMYTGQLREAAEELQGLMDELDVEARHGGRVDEPLHTAVRAALGSARYYSGWVRRLEGAPPDEWLAETTRARQHFRWLAESGDKPDGGETEGTYKRNLEAAVRLERMDLSELKGLALPEQVRCSMCKKPGDGSGDKKGKKPGIGEGEKKDMRGAGRGRRPPGSGS